MKCHVTYPLEKNNRLVNTILNVGVSDKKMAGKKNFKIATEFRMDCKKKDDGRKLDLHND